MDTQTMPSAWAKLRAHIYRFGGFTITLAACLGQLGLVPMADAMAGITTLIPIVLLAGLPHIWGHLSGNTTLVCTEAQAWANTSPIRTLRCWNVAAYPTHLRETGAIGADLHRACAMRATGRQSGGHKSGSGGHKKPASSSGSDDSDGGGEPPASLPLICTIHDLAGLLQVTAKTLQNQPKSALPPAIHIPGCRGPRYRLRDVLTWLDSFPVGRAKPPINPQGKTGRPRLATPAQIAATRAKGM